MVRPKKIVNYEENPLYLLMKERRVKESTLKQYMTILTRLNDGVMPVDVEYLKDTLAIETKLNKYQYRTRANLLSPVVNVLKNNADMKRYYDHYYKLMIKYANEGNTQNEMSDKQKSNWITQEEVLNIHSNLKAETEALFKRKKGLTPDQYDKVFKYVLLSLFVLQRPRRNQDYLLCYIVRHHTPQMSDKRNYLCLGSGQFIFNVYKTDQIYKTQRVRVSEDLREVITKWIKIHPLGGSFMANQVQEMPLLCDQLGNPLSNGTVITNKFKEIFNRDIGVSMLRNIYLTNEFRKCKEDLKQISYDMGTSENMILQTYTKLSNPNP